MKLSLLRGLVDMQCEGEVAIGIVCANLLRAIATRHTRPH
jgi:hypothetical protein